MSLLRSSKERAISVMVSMEVVMGEAQFDVEVAVTATAQVRTTGNSVGTREVTTTWEA